MRSSSPSERRRSRASSVSAVSRRARSVRSDSSRASIVCRQESSRWRAWRLSRATVSHAASAPIDAPTEALAGIEAAEDGSAETEPTRDHRRSISRLKSSGVKSATRLSIGDGPGGVLTELLRQRDC